ncbi:MAG: hypothetical protein FRX49_00870 [Trebouxia sp. A1-2]|nr:MAG: hypothetical protein FRX49_00870 [Trebouxia sp. A1-2]
MIGVQDVLQAVTGMAQDGSKKPTPVYQPPKFRLRVPREDARRDDCEAQALGSRPGIPGMPGIPPGVAGSSAAALLVEVGASGGAAPPIIAPILACMA